eukprot:678828-Prorocentrum_minimum.AAC.2
MGGDPLPFEIEPPPRALLATRSQGGRHGATAATRTRGATQGAVECEYKPGHASTVRSALRSSTCKIDLWCGPPVPPRRHPSGRSHGSGRALSGRVSGRKNGHSGRNKQAAQPRHPVRGVLGADAYIHFDDRPADGSELGGPHRQQSQSKRAQRPEAASDPGALGEADHCICVLRGALCFTSVIQSWGPKSSPLIIRFTYATCALPSLSHTLPLFQGTFVPLVYCTAHIEDASGILHF